MKPIYDFKLLETSKGPLLTKKEHNFERKR